MFKLRIITLILLMALQLSGLAASPAASSPANASYQECSGISGFSGDKRWTPGLPDTTSRYDSYSFKTESGNFDAIRISGRFPYARYFSLNVYDFNTGDVIAAMPDFAIEPLAGHTNPFRPGADRTASDRSFEVYLVKAGSNAEFDAGASVLELPPGVESISTITRVVRPDQGMDNLGGVEQTKIEAIAMDSPAKCPASGQDLSSTLDLFKLLYFPEWLIAGRAKLLELGGDDMIFLHAAGAGLFPNEDNKYLYTALKNTGVAVLEFRAPEFVNTYNASLIFLGRTQTRYWSLCVSGLAFGSTSNCIIDDMVKLNDSGKVTLVVGPEYLRAKTEKAGLNFLARGLVYKPVILHRHMMDAPDFRGSLNLVPLAPRDLPDDFSRADLDQLDARKYIGAYSPSGRHMSLREYEAWLRDR